MNGEGELIFQNGNVIKGTFQNGGILGDVEILYTNKDQYIGQVKLGQENGKGSYIYNNGDKY